MLEILYGLSVLSAKVLIALKHSKENHQSKIRAYNNGSLTYYDYRGARRMLNDNTVVVSEKLKNGDRVLTDIHGNIIHNLSEQQSKYKIDKYNNNNMNESKFKVVGTFDHIYPDKVRKDIYKYIYGKEMVVRYKDKDYLRERTFNHLFFGCKYIYTRIDDGNKYVFECVNNKAIEKLNDWNNKHTYIKPFGTSKFDLF